MEPKKRLGLVVLLLTVTSVLVLGVAVLQFYRMTLASEHKRLSEMLHAQSTLISAVARFDAKFSAGDNPEGAPRATISQIQEANRTYKGFGNTGEFTLARREGDMVTYLLDFWHDGGSRPSTVAFEGVVDVPMRQALQGGDGTIVATDYRGVEVLAAYGYVPELALGLVAKIDMEEIRAPFVEMIWIAVMMGTFLILSGSLLFQRLTASLFHRIVTEEERLRAVVDTAVDGIISIDAKGRVGAFNPAAERLSGYAAAEVIGRNVKMLMPEPYQGEHDGYLERFIRTGEAKVIGIGREVVGRRKDGSTFPMDLAVSEMRLKEGVLFTDIVRDLTERKRLEEQVRGSHSLRTIGRVAGSVAHHVNNLLQVVRSNSEILSKLVGLEEKPRRALTRIDDALKQIAPVMDQLLSFSGRQREGMTSLDLGDLVLEMLPLMQALLGGETSVKAHVPEELRVVRGNRAMLKDAVLQLCLNAKEAMPDGGVVELSIDRVELSQEFTGRHAWASTGSYAVVRVRDQGMGMTTEQCEALFNTETARLSGSGLTESGLGLSIIRGVVGSHGGGLAASSTPGKGTEVGLYLPLVTEAEGRPTRKGA